jgi:tetratricopeptide (TPR) repeat protein
LFSPELEKHRSEGLARLASGRYDEAIIHFTKIIDDDPDYPATYNAYFCRAQACWKKGQVDRALADYGHVIRLLPYDMAVDRFTHPVIGRDPLNPLPDYLLGLIRLEKCEYDAAIADFTRVISLYPKWAAPYSDRGFALLGKGEYERAVQDCSSAIDLDSGYPAAYGNRGKVYGAMGNCAVAIRDYNKWIELDPDDPSAYEVRADAYEALGDKVGAESDLEKASELRAKHAERPDAWYASMQFKQLSRIANSLSPKADTDEVKSKSLLP